MPIGQLDVRLISREYASPNPNDQEEKNARLRELYDSISAVYTGVVKPSPKEGAPFGVTVELYHVDIKNPTTGVVTTVLRAYYNRTSDPNRERELSMSVDYQPDTKSISMASDSNSAYSGTLNGTIDKGIIRGVFKNQRNLGGPVVLCRPEVKKEDCK